MNQKRIPLLLYPIVTFVVYYFLMANYFPNSMGNIGHDYSLFFPHLLDGFYWYRQNGLWQVPWFTPSFGGGLPKFPNPQSMYYSCPQFLCFIFDPLTAVKFTILIFGVIGYYGFYKLLNRVFKLNFYSSILGATLFLFNGFYFTRMIVGHLTFHPYMLMPLFIYFVFKKGTKAFSVRQIVSDCIFGALLMAYVIYAGGFHMVPIILYVSLLTFLFYALYFNGIDRIVWIKGVFSVLLGVALSASVLNAGISYIALFNRDFYPLPGYNNLGALFKIWFESLFLKVDSMATNAHFVNKKNTFMLHEFEYGITIIPLFLLFWGIYYFAKNKFDDFFTRKMIIFAFLFWILLLIPLMVNLYTSSWNYLLKSLPFIKSSSILIRWFSIYIPIFILFGAVSFEKLSIKGKKYWTILLVFGIIVLSQINLDNNHYQKERYNPELIQNAYHRSNEKGFKPQITDITNILGPKDNLIKGNNVLVEGCSQIVPYEPIFGYGLEQFPLGKLRPGSVWLSVDEKHLNLKNPVSYVFPEENGLKPGDHFKVDEKEKVQSFVNYTPFDFEFSARQKFANLLTLFSFSAVLFFGLYNLIIYLKKRLFFKSVR